MTIRESLAHAEENLTKARLGLQRLWCLAHSGHLEELDADVLELSKWLLEASVGVGEALESAGAASVGTGRKSRVFPDLGFPHSAEMPANEGGRGFGGHHGGDRD